MTVPTFSVLLPTRNRAELLAQAIATVRAQDEADWEIVVSDNASTDDVKGLVDGIADPRIVYLRSDVPLPVTANWNRALEASRGRSIIMLGDDDGLVPGFFRRMREALVTLGDPDLVYFGAYHFAWPGVLPGSPDGAMFDVTRMHSFLRERQAPGIIPADEAHVAARAALDMRAVYGFNMQYFLFRRDLLDRMRRFGDVFRGPYPDFYAANMALLQAERVGAVPEPMTIIGISPKSYGYFHFNDDEAAGVGFLENQHFRDDVAPALRGQLLPGSYMNTLWLVSVALVAESLPDDRTLLLGVRRYRRLQILDAVLRRLHRGQSPFAAIGPLWPLLRTGERALLAALAIGLAPATLLPERYRVLLSTHISRLAGQYGRQPAAPRRLPDTPSDMLAAVECLRTPQGVTP